MHTQAEVRNIRDANAKTMMQLEKTCSQLRASLEESLAKERESVVCCMYVYIYIYNTDNMHMCIYVDMRIHIHTEI